MQVLVKNWLVGTGKTEMAHLWTAVNVWLKYRSGLVVRLSHSTNLNGALKIAGIIGLEEASSAIAAF